jgi:hypothetical protein
MNRFRRAKTDAKTKSDAKMRAGRRAALHTS